MNDTDLRDTLDEIHMRHALLQARVALARGDAGYGCIIVLDEAAIGVGNGSETTTDCTCHSEVVAIRMAQARVNGLLHGATLYSTFVPCMACCGNINHSKVSRVVYGADREDIPHMYRQRNIHAVDLLNDTSTPPEVVGGVLRAECIAVTESIALW